MKIEVLEKLKRYQKSYFSTRDIAEILEVKPSNIYVVLNRLVKYGVLIRLKQGVYQVYDAEINPKKIANKLYYPSYLSFESALSRYGVLSQLPYTLTFATLRKTKEITLYNTHIQYSQIKEELFFGFYFLEETYIAYPEKAFLDMLYFVSLGRTNMRVMDISKLNFKRLVKWAKKYPLKTRRLLSEYKFL